MFRYWPAAMLLFPAFITGVSTSYAGQASQSVLFRLPHHCRNILQKSVKPLQALLDSTLKKTSERSTGDLFMNQMRSLEELLRQKAYLTSASFSHVLKGVRHGHPSGDLIDTMLLGDNKWLIRFGDVMGHDRRAADVSFALQKTLHSTVTTTILTEIYKEERGLTDSIGAMEALLQQRDKDSFMYYTMTSSVIDPIAQTVTSIFSGSNAFFRLRPANGAVTVDRIYSEQARTPFISLDTRVASAYEYADNVTPHTINYQSGDILVYMSDGLLDRAVSVDKGENSALRNNHRLLRRLIATSFMQSTRASFSDFSSILYAKIVKNSKKISADDTSIFAVKLP